MDLLIASNIVVSLSLFIAFLVGFFTRKTRSSRDERRIEVLCLYATQTGTAAEMAKRVALHLESVADTYSCRVKNVAEYSSGFCDVVLLFLSTYGDGECPDSCDPFEAVCTQMGRSLFGGAAASIFGLGDSAYPMFNAYAKRIDFLLREQKIPLLKESVYGDASRSLWKEFYAWQLSALTLVFEKFSPPGRLAGHISGLSTLSQPPDRYDLRILAHASPPIASERAHFASLDAVSSDCIYHIVRLRLERAPSMKIRAGYHLGIAPENPPEIVDALMQRLRLGPNLSVELVDRTNALPVFSGTFRELFLRYFDLSAPISESAISHLIRIAEDSAVDRQYLQSLIDSYKALVLDEYLNVAEVLQTLGSYNVTVKSALPCFQKIQPRLYSIASFSPSTRELEILIKEITFETPKRVMRCGLTSGYLLSVPDSLAISLRKSSFHLFKHIDRAIIMIAAGTGIAPFIGFIRERASHGSSMKKERKPGAVHLYFGCRKMQDVPIHEELAQNLKNGVLTSLNFALSQTAGVPKTWVQDVLLRDADKISQLLFRNHAIVYVCGNAHRMSVAVRAAFVQIIKQSKGCTDHEAANELLKLISAGQYKQDIY